MDKKRRVLMDYMLNIARIFGPLLAITSFWHLTYRKEAYKIIDSIKKTPAMYYFGCTFNLLLGLVIIVLVPNFESNISFFIPLLGWFLFIRAIVVLFFPGVFKISTQNNENLLILMSLIGLIWGLLICWYGYIYLGY